MKILIRIECIYDFPKVSACGAESEQVLVLGSAFPPTEFHFSKLQNKTG